MGVNRCLIITYEVILERGQSWAKAHSTSCPVCLWSCWMMWLISVILQCAFDGGTSERLNVHLQDGSLQNSCDMCISLWAYTNAKDPSRSLFDMDEGRFSCKFQFSLLGMKPLNCIQRGSFLQFDLSSNVYIVEHTSTGIQRRMQLGTNFCEAVKL